MPTDAPTQPRIGLALSGGGVRGLAHLGVLQVMEQNEVPVGCIAGTSMGGLVGGLYAAGVPLPDLLEVGVSAGIMDFAAPDRSWRGLFQHKKMASYLADILGSPDLTFEDLRFPLCVVATDVETGEVVLLDRGPLIPALLATSSFPIMFAPVRYQERWLVDGGVLNNFPVDIVRHMGADRVLGVNVPPSVKLPLEPAQERGGLSPGSLISFSNRTRDWKTPFLIAETSVSWTSGLITQERLERCPPDLLLEVHLPNVGVFATGKNAQVIEAGRAVAMSHLAELVDLKTRALPSPWSRRLDELRRRLQRAWEAFCEPAYPCYPPSHNDRLRGDHPT